MAGLGASCWLRRGRICCAVWRTPWRGPCRQLLPSVLGDGLSNEDLHRGSEGYSFEKELKDIAGAGIARGDLTRKLALGGIAYALYSIPNAVQIYWEVKFS